MVCAIYEKLVILMSPVPRLVLVCPVLLKWWCPTGLSFVPLFLFCRYCCSFSKDMVSRMLLMSLRFIPNFVSLMVLSSMAHVILGLYYNWVTGRVECSVQHRN